MQEGFSVNRLGKSLKTFQFQPDVANKLKQFYTIEMLFLCLTL